ncbi:MAG: hypothetical protein WDO69_18510 [Pseudomonadota bacterium]
MVFVLLEGVVGSERVRGDDEVAVLARCQWNGQWQSQTALGALPVDDLAYSADMDRAALKDLDERVLEGVAARSVE